MLFRKTQDRITAPIRNSAITAVWAMVIAVIALIVAVCAHAR
jgi:hypothetical protein